MHLTCAQSGEDVDIRVKDLYTYLAERMGDQALRSACCGLRVKKLGNHPIEDPQPATRNPQLFKQR
jgi:hypothetical protein